MSFKKASSWAPSALFAFFLFMVSSGCGVLSKAGGESFFSTDTHPNPLHELDYDFRTQATRTFPDNSLVLNAVIDDKFSGPERELVKKGLEEWERATSGTVRFLFAPQGSWNSNDPILAPAADPSTGIIRCSNDVYVVRSFHTDKAIVDVETAIKEETKKTITIAGYAHPACRAKYFFIVADRVDNPDRYITLTIHEMGHILGLKHVEIQQMTVMYPGLPNDSSCVSLIDIVQFCQLWKCDVKEMHPCHL